MLQKKYMFWIFAKILSGDDVADRLRRFYSAFISHESFKSYISF
jgi:hypothetical protein